MRDFSRDEAKKSKSLFIRVRRIERRDGILSRRMLTRRRSDTGIQRLIGVVPLTRYRFARVLLPFARGRVLLREREREHRLERGIGFRFGRKFARRREGTTSDDRFSFRQEIDERNVCRNVCVLRSKRRVRRWGSRRNKRKEKKRGVGSSGEYVRYLRVASNTPNADASSARFSSDPV